MSGSHTPIRRLPETLVNQIAAGEVVERPAAAVKELVENALDAGAGRIDIAVREGGRALLTVSDDGSGMTPEELELAVERHATSKLPEGDLTHIATLGFRGEALPSIGAVSRLTLTSRIAGADSAWSLTVEGGTKGAVQPASHPPGTRVEVRDLFYAVPARLKFLKAARTEFEHITEVVERLAMAHPRVGFFLSGDARSCLRLPAVTEGDVEAARLVRLAAIMGAEFGAQAVPLRAEREFLRLEGHIGVPTLHRPTARQQFLFVNGRPVRDKLLAGAVRAAYGDFLPRDRHPLLALFLSIPPREVDVNVHPAKTEVRFRDAGLVRGVMVTALRQALAAAGHRSAASAGAGPLGEGRLRTGRPLEMGPYSGAPVAGMPVAARPAWPETAPDSSASPGPTAFPGLPAGGRSDVYLPANAGTESHVPYPGTMSHGHSNIPRGLAERSLTFQEPLHGAASATCPPQSPLPHLHTPPQARSAETGHPLLSTEFLSTESMVTAPAWPSGSDGPPRPELEPNTESGITDADSPATDGQMHPLGAARAQIHHTYILAETAVGLVIVDQHAAHERLVYERIKEGLAAGAIARQILLIPEVVDLEGRGAERLSARADELAELGLVLESFGVGAVVVREVPALLGQINVAALVRDLADELAEWDTALSLRARLYEVCASMACHGSVRAGRALNPDEMNALLRQMEATPHSGQCSHGRPTYITLRLSDIERLFGRR